MRSRLFSARSRSTSRRSEGGVLGVGVRSGLRRELGHPVADRADVDAEAACGLGCGVALVADQPLPAEVLNSMVNDRRATGGFLLGRHYASRQEHHSWGRSDYRGYLQADAYSGYDRIYSRGVVEVGRFAHARRKFYDSRTSDPERAHEALARIRLLYAVEAAGKDLDEAGRLALRRERSVPLLERLGTWLDEQARVVLPKSPIGGAIGYARSNWWALNRFTEAGFLSIDNNASERAVKPVAIGRRNWLFAGARAAGGPRRSCSASRRRAGP